MKRIKRIYYCYTNIEYYALDNVKNPKMLKPQMLNFDQLKNIDPGDVWASLNDENYFKVFLEEYINL